MCRMLLLKLAVLASFTLIVGSLAGAAETPSLPFVATACVRVATPPTVDGKLDDACWQSTRAMKPFVKLTLGTPAEAQSVAYMVHDAEKLYLGVHCDEPNMAKLKAEVTKRDGPTFGDDCIEIFLIPTDSKTLATYNERDRYFHLVVNALGTRYDEIGLEAPASFDGDWEAATSRGPDGWELEVAVPFAQLGASVKSGSVWAGNVSRARWQAREYSTWSPLKRSFHDKANFGRIVFTQDLSAVADKLDEVEFTALQAGLLGPAVLGVERSVAAARRNTSGLPENCRPRMEKAVRNLESRLRSLQARCKSLTVQNFRDQWLRLYQRLEPVRFEAFRLQDEAVMLAATGGGARPWSFFITKPVTNDRLLSDRWPRQPRLMPRLTLTACPGEYESATFSVYGVRELKDVRLEISDLKAGAAVLSASCVEPYAVKCWYQAGRGIGDLGQRLLTSELLLKDDDLVRVDYLQQANFVRSRPGASDYLDCSLKSSANLAGLVPRDADKLLPLTIPERTLKQFWLTARIPAGTPAGAYTGQVTVSAEGVSPQRLPLEIMVLPFELADPVLEYSIYYRGVLTPDGKGSISSERKSEEQFAAEMRDLVAHGVVNPTIYQSYDEKLLSRVLELREAAGMKGKSVMSLGISTGAPTTPAALEDLRKRVVQYLDFVTRRGYPGLYVYGIDEASGDALKAEREAFKAVHEAGAKVYVACYKDYFPLVGDLLDMPVWAGRPDPQEAVKAHGVGHRIFNYANPQCGVEEPETYRRNFGLVLWQAGYDGAMDYAYQHSFGHEWNDFDNQSYRDHTMAYPAENGVIGTIQWEGFREGVDDVRYLTTLLQAVKAAKAAGGSKAREAAATEAWLTQLKSETSDLDTVRQEMIRRILKLR
ncbi:MAG: carbohydrate binding family 9 domain-containing protein [Armatimonadota bacterium]